MAGLLTEQPGQAAPQPEQAAPQPEQPMQEGATEQAQPQGGGEIEKTEQLVKVGVDILYGQLFEKLVEMFKKGGVEGFPKSMAFAINKVIEEIEKKEKINPEIAAAVGTKLFWMLIEDIIGGGIVPKIDTDVITMALHESMRQYGESHGIPQETMDQLTQGLAQKAQEGVGS